MCRPVGAYLFCGFAFQGKGVIAIVLGKLGNHAKLGEHVLIPRFGVGNIAPGAVLDALLQIHKISPAFVTKGIQRAAAKHTVKIVAAYFVAGKKFTGIVFEIGAAVFHSPSLCQDHLSCYYYITFTMQKARVSRKVFGLYRKSKRTMKKHPQVIEFLSYAGVFMPSLDSTYINQALTQYKNRFLKI